MESEPPSDFFAVRGFELRFVRDGEVVWAELRSTRDRSVSIPKFGRGFDEKSAALRAIDRWHQEQRD